MQSSSEEKLEKIKKIMEQQEVLADDKINEIRKICKPDDQYSKDIKTLKNRQYYLKNKHPDRLTIENKAELDKLNKFFDDNKKGITKLGKNVSLETTKIENLISHYTSNQDSAAVPNQTTAPIPIPTTPIPSSV